MRHLLLPDGFPVQRLPFYLAMEEWAARSLGGVPDDIFFMWQVQFESDIPSHCALPLGRDIFKHFHVELPFVVNYRDSSAVHETYACVLPKTGESEEHGLCHETAWHDFDNTAV